MFGAVYLVVVLTSLSCADNVAYFGWTGDASTTCTPFLQWLIDSWTWIFGIDLVTAMIMAVFPLIESTNTSPAANKAISESPVCLPACVHLPPNPSITPSRPTTPPSPTATQ